MIALLKLVAILFLVVTNGYFVASEFALVSVRRARLEARAAAGSKNARAALRLLNNPTIFISAVQFGITLASTRARMDWRTNWLRRCFNQWLQALAGCRARRICGHLVAIVIAFSAITFLHIVLGELMPKMIALDRAEKIALVCSRPLDTICQNF